MLFSLPDDEKSSIRALRLLTEVTLFSNLMPRSSRLYAGVAQLVEQRIRNAKVVGSTPIIGTIKSISYEILFHKSFPFFHSRTYWRTYLARYSSYHNLPYESISH